MDLSRINQLQDALDNECIDLTELAEIEEAFKDIPTGELRDLPDNATAGDMLEELRSEVGPIERRIYNWVMENFGEDEANNPSWSIGALALELNEMPVGIGAEEVTLGRLLGGEM